MHKKVKLALYFVVALFSLIALMLFLVTRLSEVHPAAVRAIQESPEVAQSVGKGPLTLVLTGYRENASNAYSRCADLHYLVKGDHGWAGVDVRLEVNKRPGWKLVEVAGPASQGITKACFSPAISTSD